MKSHTPWTDETDVQDLLAFDAQQAGQDAFRQALIFGVRLR
jgi:hypothetical protein